MLHYEKSSKENQLIIAYKNQKGIFTKDFFLALLIAALIHGSFVLLFNIKDIGLLSSFSANLSMNVESDLAYLYNELGQEAFGNFEVKTAILEPPFFEKFPPMEEITFSPMPKNELIADLPPLILPKIYEPKFVKEGAEKRQELHFSFLGDFSEKERVIPLNEFEKNFLARFSIKIDERSGRIFWIEPILSSGSLALDQKLLNIIKGIQMEPNDDAFVKSGEIEIKGFYD